MENKTIHIVLLSNTAFSLWNFKRALLQDWIKKGYQVTCVAATDECAEKLKEQGATFIHIPLSRSGTNIMSEISVIFSLYGLLKNIKPDIIFSYTIKPNAYVPIVAKILSVPCVAVVTGLGYAFLKKNIIAFMAKTLLKASLKLTTHIWFLNKDDQKEICGDNIALIEKSSCLPGEGIDVKYFDDSLFPKNKTDKPVILMIARILKDKGVYEFAAAAKIVQKKYPVEFQFLGAIDRHNPAALTENEWEILTKDSGVTYMGTASDVRPFIAASTICVLPSYREGIPFSLLEAGSMKRLLVATDVAGCRDIIEHGVTGLLVNPRDEKSLACAIFKMLEMDEGQRENMGKKCRENICQKFSTDIILQKYQNILIRLAQKNDK